MFSMRLLLVLVVTCMEVCGQRDDPSRDERQYSPGVLLRDLMNAVEEAATAPSIPGLDGDLDLESSGYDSGDEDLLSSLTEHGVMSERPSAHFLLGLYERLQAGQRLPEASGHSHDSETNRVTNSDTIRSFTSAAVDEGSRSDLTMNFRLTGMRPEEQTQLAELRLRPLEPSTSGRRHRTNRRQLIKVTVYQGDEAIKSRRYRVRVNRQVDNGFDVMEITRIVEEMTSELEEMNNTRIEVTIPGNRREQRNQNNHSRQRRSINTEADAVLVIYSKDPDFFTEFNKMTSEISQDHGKSHHRHSRMRRNANRRSRNNDVDVEGNRGLCEKSDFIVDFTKIGWDQWIIYPKRFNAFQCSGRCPLPVDSHYDPTNHAVMQSLMRLYDRTSVGRPCCVPIKLQPLSMLYYEYGEIVVRHHEDMVVDKCGCR